MDLHLPTTPKNLRFPTHLRGLKMVEHDVHSVCDRIKELDPNLFVVLQEGHEKPWVVMETTRTGDHEMVSRYEHLGSYIIDDLKRMLSIPFEKRMEALFKKVDAENEQKEHAWKETEQHERFMWDFRKALNDSGIANFRWGTSYRPVKGVSNGSR